MPKQDIYLMAGPFGVDRRESAVVKRNPGILYELENYLIHNGVLEVREGQTNSLSTLDGSNITSLEEVAGTGYQILALHRFYGLTATETELREFYAAVDGASNATIRKWSGTQWDTLPLPPGITLTAGQQGNFEQLKDRTYYTNQKEPVLMIKKEVDQVFEAGIPDADPELEIAFCEELTEAAHPPGAGEWTFYTDGEANMVRHFRDGGFERHTEGDFGLTLEQSDFSAAKTLKAIYHLPSTLNLEWFYTISAGGGSETTGSTDGVTLTDSAATFTDAHIGLQIENTTDGSTAVIVQRNSANQVITTELSGGSDNLWENGDSYTMGSRSTLNDYIAIDIFRFNKPDIDEVVMELSSTAPDASGDFSKGFRVVIYTDSDMEHFSLRQRTMLAEWAMNPYSNKLFFGRFRKQWFIDIDDTSPDDWSTINYFKVHIQSNDETNSSNPIARITIDNVRLLKTPPLPAELSILVNACDAVDTWVNSVTLANLDNDYIYATQGVSCKKIPSGVTAKATWTGYKDLSAYDEGTDVDGSDIMVFDVCGNLDAIGSLATVIRLYDKNGYNAKGTFTVFGDLRNAQQRHIHIQEFELSNKDFEWDNVDYMTVANAGFTNLYIDNIRIEPASASKLINKFVPMDLIIADAFNRGLNHWFPEGSIVDTISDWLFHAYANFTRQATGQGELVFPEYTHGRYKIGDYSLASMQLQVDAGGSMTVTFNQNDDLTEYEEFNFNLDGFLFPRQANKSGNWMGVDWVEIPGTPEDEFSIWISTPDITAITKIIFRFYANANANFEADTGKHTGLDDSKILTKTGGAAFTSALVGRRIRNESWTDGHAGNRWGIVGWVNTVTGDSLGAWGMVWDTDDEFTIDDYAFTVGGGYKGFTFKKGGIAGRPTPDADNYYEYVLDVNTMFTSLDGVVKGYNKALEYPNENEENLIAVRELAKDYGLQRVYKEGEEEDDWWQAILTWKRRDMIPHLKSDSPWSSLQCIAAHEIMVQASSEKNAIINFQDFRIAKKGAIKGDNIKYRIKLEDELGYLGPASDESKGVTVTGKDVNLSDIVIPYDTRIVRKRIYRTDSLGQYRYVDTIDRIESSYLDQIPEDLLGNTIEEDIYKPPKARHMRKVDNRMAYIDVVDRRGTRRPSRIHFSLPFIPHQCRDADALDIAADDGQKVIWCEFYYGYILVWKERSFYTIDPYTFEKSPRDLSIGCIAPLSVAPIPGLGFGWLSHEGVIFGDHSNIDKDTGEQIWDDIKDYTPDQLSRAVAWYNDRYYYIFLGLDSGVYNTKGYACYLPAKLWTTITGWNVQCVSKWTGGSDNSEMYTGSDYGYINKLFDGEEDLDDDGTNAASQITSRLRMVDYDFGKPHVDKYINWIIFHAKNLSSDPSRKSLLTITPYYDQLPKTPLNDEEVELSTYKKYDLCQDPGECGTLVGFSIDGKKRHAIKELILDVNDQGFRPDQDGA